MTKKCKITVEVDGQTTFTYEYDNVEITQEKGIERVVGVGTDVVDIGPNGQERMTILAWSGITDFEKFEEKTIKIV